MSSMKPHISALAICVVLTACTSLGREARLQISEFTKIIKQATNDNACAEAYIKRGYVYPIRYSLKILADYTQAIALATNNDTTQAVALYSDDNEKSFVYARRAEMYTFEQQYGKAIDYCTKAIDLVPEFYKRRGQTYEEPGEDKKAGAQKRSHP